VTNH